MNEDMLVEAELHLQRLAMAQVAAHWWRRTLETGRAPSLLRDAGFGKGQALEGAFGDGLIGIIRKRHVPITPEQYDLFEWGLGLQVMGASKYGPLRFLRTDYHPDQAIYAAGEAAGIDMQNYDLRFPFKVHMCIRDEEVEVRGGESRDYEALVETKRGVIRKQVSKRLYDEQGERAEYGTPEYTRMRDIENRATAAIDRLPLNPAGIVEKIVDMLIFYARGESNLQPLAVEVP